MEVAVGGGGCGAFFGGKGEVSVDLDFVGRSIVGEGRGEGSCRGEGNAWGMDWIGVQLA